MTKTASKKKKLKCLVVYELRNLIGNWFIPFFGLIFPLFLGILFAMSIFNDIPAAYKKEALTSLVITMVQIVPLATIFLGYGSIYSQDLENRLPLRMQLFGFDQLTQMKAKMIASFVFLTFSLAINLIVMGLVIDIVYPTVMGAAKTVLSLYLLALTLFILAHAIANFLRKFGPSYAIIMVLYFVFMILGGMMGLRPDDFPSWMSAISKLLPFQYISSDFYKVWMGKPYDFMPYIQSSLFFGALSVTLMIASLRYRKNKTI